MQMNMKVGVGMLMAQLHARKRIDTKPPKTPAGTVWVGGLPAALLDTSSATQSATLSGLCHQFGAIATVTVREKPGENKSWALVTYVDEQSATDAVAAGITAPAESDGAPVELLVKLADVATELAKGQAGRLADTVSRHTGEVDAAHSLLAAELEGKDEVLLYSISRIIAWAKSHQQTPLQIFAAIEAEESAITAGSFRHKAAAIGVTLDYRENALIMVRFSH